MTKSILERYEDAHAAFMRGDIESQTDDQLLTHLSGLSNQNNTNTGTQHRDVIRGLTINNLLLKRHLNRLQEHITELNRQNSRTQVLVIALTIASLLGTVGQVWYAYRADAKGEREQEKAQANPALSGRPPSLIPSGQPSQPAAPSGPPANVQASAPR